jgi:anti-anti-sigma regulatory factor
MKPAGRARLDSDGTGEMSSTEHMPSDSSPELSSPEAHYSAMSQVIEGLHIGVCVWRLEREETPASLRLVIANPAAYQFLGVTREQVFGRLIHEGFPGSEAAPLPAIFTEMAMRGGARDLGAVPYGDDVVERGMFRIQAAAIGPRLVCVQFTNVTEQMRLEALQRALSLQAEETRREAARSHGLVVELQQKLDIIAAQSAQIRALSSPILDLWGDVLAVPIIGEFEGVRAAELTETLLAAVVARRARAVILDVTGVSRLDQEGALLLGRLVAAVRLLGAEGVITGIRPQLAETLAALGHDASQLRTYQSLSDGLRACASRRPA